MPRPPSAAERLISTLVFAGLSIGLSYAGAALVAEPSQWTGSSHALTMSIAGVVGAVIGLALLRRGSVKAAQAYERSQAEARFEAAMRGHAQAPPDPMLDPSQRGPE